MVQTGGGIRFDKGNEKNGLYILMEGADLSGYHVLENRKYDGTMGAYWRVKVWPEYGSLNIGMTFFGEHYSYNELGMTYGLGGYFSPEVYFLGAIPITYTGHYGTNWHYIIAGAVGIQAFEQASQIYFPLDPGRPDTLHERLQPGPDHCAKLRGDAALDQHRPELQHRCGRFVPHCGPLVHRRLPERQQYEQLQHGLRRFLCAVSFQAAVPDGGLSDRALPA